MLINTGMNSHPCSLDIKDLNNDQYLDIVVGYCGINSIGIFFGDEIGSFSNQMMYSTGNSSSSSSSSRSLIIADLNKDLRFDIIVANYETKNLCVFLGQVNGTFESEKILFSNDDYYPYKILQGNSENDQQIDILTINYDFSYIDIIRTYKDFTFSNQITFQTTGYDSDPESLAFADLNNDQQIDMIVANYWTNNIGIFYGLSNGIFSNQRTYSTGSGSGPCFVTTADLNNDQRIDIIVANYWTNNICIFFGNQQNSFDSRQTYSTASNSNPYFLTIDDVNNDQQLDIIVANYGTNNIGIFLGFGNKTFSKQITYSTGSRTSPRSLAIGDLNNDRQKDIIVLLYRSNNLMIFLGYGNGSFGNSKTYSTGTSSNPISISLADMNNDHQLDVIVANYLTNNIVLFRGYNNGTLSQSLTYTIKTCSGPYSLANGDFNHDNQIDIVVVCYESSSFHVFFGYGNGSLALNSIDYYLDMNSKPYFIVVQDLNRDNQTDLAIVNYGRSEIDIYFGYSNGSFQINNTYSTRGSSKPQSVLIDDFNNDHHLDIAVVNYYSSYLNIYLGNGDGTFSKPTLTSTGSDSGPYSIASGDFNNDTYLDIAVANYDMNNLGILLGYGNGSFRDIITYSTGDYLAVFDVAVGDLNNDHRLDIAIVNNDGDDIGLFFGYGNGTFSNRVILSIGSSSGPRSIDIIDLNHDMHLDLVIVNEWTNDINIFLGYGNGSFKDKISYSNSKGSGAYYSTVVDLNNDNHLDIIVLLYSNRGAVIFLGHGDGTFHYESTYSTGSDSGPYSCTTGDLNNDTYIDILISDCTSGQIIILYGFGDGRFSDEKRFSTIDRTCLISIAVADLNYDNHLDIVVANFDANNIGILFGYSYINSFRENSYLTGSSPHPRAISFGDFNNDNQFDIVIANSQSNTIGILLGHMNGTFPTQTRFSTGLLSIPISTDVGDFNHDHFLDIAVANSASENIGVFFGYGNGSFESQETYSTGSGSIPQSLVVGDFNSDQVLDIAVADSANNEISILLRYNSGSFRKQMSFHLGLGSTPWSVTVGDLNNDGLLDFVAITSGTGSLHIYLGLSNGSFQNKSIYSVNTDWYPWHVVVWDLNKDTCLDMIVSYYWYDAMGIFFGLCDGTFTNQTTYSTGSDSGPNHFVVIDLNNDTYFDIVVANGFTDTVGILYGKENGTFSNIITYSTGTYSNPTSVGVADLNNDNQLDLVVANFGTDDIVIFFNLGNKTFSKMISYSAGYLTSPSSVVIGDFNKDNHLDIATAHFTADQIGIFFGSTNGTFLNQTILPLNSDSGPYWLSLADFNNDNQLDLIYSGSLNDSVGILLGCFNGTFFSPIIYSTGEDSQPFVTAIADFNNDSYADFIVCNGGRTRQIFIMEIKVTHF
ncbi:hypothetical protein I4U23_021564 [Adineta vaga]|nr:hypothetical protein I4U23_021564 [Adineta vaga]